MAGGLVHRAPPGLVSEACHAALNERGTGLVGRWHGSGPPLSCPRPDNESSPSLIQHGSGDTSWEADKQPGPSDAALPKAVEAPGPVSILVAQAVAFPPTPCPRWGDLKRLST